MRIAIYVYQPTSIKISTNESDVYLYGMVAAPVPLPAGDSTHTVASGIYKIVSSQEVKVTGDDSAFEAVSTNNKENDPTPPPLRATESFAFLDLAALYEFMTMPNAKVGVNP